MKKTNPTWNPETLKAYRKSRNWPDIPEAMVESVVAAIHGIQDFHDNKTPDFADEPAMLFQPTKREG